jgi:hypothetical protein
MTPYGTRLKDNLDTEVLRMQKEWFFKWHFIKEHQGVEIESFNGSNIHYGGIQYSGSAHQVYWATLRRYLALRLGEYFDSAVEALERFPQNISSEIIGEFDQLLKNFCSRIADIAAEKDRILRGIGTEFPEIDNSRKNELVDNFGILEKTNSLKSLLKALESGTISPAIPFRSHSIQIILLTDNELLSDLKVSLDNLIKELSASNFIGEDEPLEKQQHLAELQAAKELLKAPQVEKKSFGLLIGRALKWAAEKAAGTAVAEIVKTVIEAIFKIGL